MNKNLLGALATLLGATIGAGILGLPYVIYKAGFFTGLLGIIILGASILFINLALGEVALRTKGNHQLTGYAYIYHGKIGKIIISFSMIFGIFGALTAYLIGEGKALSHIFGGNEFIYTLIFLLLFSSIVLFGLKAVEKSELILTFISLFLIISIIFMSINHININNLNKFDVKNFFVPYGAIFFAFLAMPAIIEVKEELAKNKKMLKKAIIIGTLIPAFVYIIFSLVIIGVTGNETTQIATIGLSNSLGSTFTILGNLFPVFAMGTAFLVLALALKEMFIYDFKINKILSWFLTCSIPLLFILMGAKDFINILSIVGSLVAGIDGILITAIWIKAKKIGKRKPEYSININPIFLVLIFIIFILAVIKTIMMIFQVL